MKLSGITLALAGSMVILAGVAGCSKEEVIVPFIRPASCDSVALHYNGEIKGIVDTRCSYAPCHVPGTGNYDFTRYEVLADRIRAGRFEERLLLPVTSVLHMPIALDAQNLPYGVTMPDCEIYKLRLWIRQGFPE
jgi:hypothetical protein